MFRYKTQPYHRMAVAVFNSPTIKGEVIFSQDGKDTVIQAILTQLPPGQHGFHIHSAGDLRGEGCQGACDHYHVGPKQSHGGPPGMPGQRHTGDLGNVSGPLFEAQYRLKNVHVDDLLGRSVIIHEDPDDLGQGPFEDSTTTGHSGKRIGCAIIGRVKPCTKAKAPAKTRKHRGH